MTAPGDLPPGDYLTDPADRVALVALLVARLAPADGVARLTGAELRAARRYRVSVAVTRGFGGPGADVVELRLEPWPAAS